MSLDQRDILLRLIQGGEGREWADERNGWDRTTEVCSWEGITCDSRDNSTVIGIQLPETDLLAYLPAQLGLLTDLQKLDLRHNLLYGTIPSEITAHLTNIVHVNLEGNQFKGAIPYFQQAKKLQHLDVSHNSFDGTIPPDYGQANKALQYFDAQKNHLTGFLPFGLEDLSDLYSISLSRNRLSGTLPQYLGNMASLQYLYLNHNNFIGTLPTTWSSIIIDNNNDDNNNETAVIDNNNTLEEIWLQSNRLSGTLPVTLSQLPHLRDLYIDDNKLTGSVPSELCKESFNADFFDGLPPNADRNFCDSLTCPPNTVSEDGVWPCQDCASTIESPYMGRTGECTDVTESSILAELVSGVIDVQETACLYEGVVCDDKRKHVVEINFAGRGLQGTIPDNLGLLSFLRVLDLSDNELTGFLPSGLRFAPIQKLDVSGNKLRGVLPPLLCAKGGINEKYDDGYGCSHIACPVGTYSTNGTVDCQLCPSSRYLASKVCVPLEEYDDDLGLGLGDDDDDNDQDLTRGVGSNPHYSGHVFGFWFVVASMFMAVFGVYLYRKSRQRRKGGGGGGRLSDYPANNIAAWEAAHSSLPHQEEVRFIERKRRKKKKKNKKRKSKAQSETRPNWMMKRLNKSYHYLISLTETEPVHDPKAKKVSKGEIDDFGWQERESILASRRQLEAQLEDLQKESALRNNTPVWEYPDPLECSYSYSQSGYEGGEDETGEDDTDVEMSEELTAWLKTQEDREKEHREKEVWLDVPRP